MKQLFYVAAVLAVFGGLLYAGENISAPAGKTANSITADYGGVDIATSAFTTAVTTVGISWTPNGSRYDDYPSTTTASANRWRVYGVNWGTGSCSSNDFVTVYRATGAYGNTQQPATQVTRFYNIYGSTSSGNALICGGLTPNLRWPIRVYGNLYFSVSGSGYNNADLLYWKEPD